MISFSTATLSDIDAVLALHALYQIDTIAESDKADGFITTNFSRAELTALITQEQGLFLAKNNDEVVGYAMAASWQYWSQWSMFSHMITELPNLSYKDTSLTVDNSYQYGPVCVHQKVRGTGVFEALFEFALECMSLRYEVLVTFINKINPRSHQAHTQKARLNVIHEFSFNNNNYYELACFTQREKSKLESL